MRETRARELVMQRSNGRCERCGGPGAEYSHRMKRDVSLWRWSPANALRLCRDCHAWAHANPGKARNEGIHVSQFQGDPSKVPVKLFSGWYLLDKKGGATWLGSRGSRASALTTY